MRKNIRMFLYTSLFCILLFMGIIYAALYPEKIRINDRTIAYPEKGFPNPEKIPSIDHQLHVFIGRGYDIYTYNPINDEVKKVSSDQIEGYEKQDMLNIAAWAMNPKINDDHTWIAYASGRRAMSEGTDEYDIWLIHLQNGTEELYVENAIPLTWVEDDLYFRTEDRGIHVMNVVSKTSEMVVSETEHVDVQNDYIIYLNPDQPTYFFYHVHSKETYTVSTDDPNSRIPFLFKVSQDNKKVLGFIFFDRRDTSSLHFMVVDLEQDTRQLIKIPSPNPALTQLGGWIDEHRFEATVFSQDGKTAKSLIIDIREGARNP